MKIKHLTIHIFIQYTILDLHIMIQMLQNLILNKHNIYLGSQNITRGRTSGQVGSALMEHLYTVYCYTLLQYNNLFPFILEFLTLPNPLFNYIISKLR